MAIRLFLSGSIATLLLLPLVSGQVIQRQATPNTQTETAVEVEEIIKLAESKLYSPIREGLKDLFFMRTLTLEKQLTSYWCKAPDRIKAIFGKPSKKTDSNEPAAIRFSKPIPVETRVPPIVARRIFGRLTGTPISALLPFGHMQIIKKDEGGTQLRFTANQQDSKNLLWTNIDFFLDPDFRLTKMMQKSVSDGHIEEFKFNFKPYKEGAKLLILDSEELMSMSQKKTTVVKTQYRYAQHEDFWLPEEVVFQVQGEDNKYFERFLGYRINQGLDDKVFEE